MIEGIISHTSQKYLNISYAPSSQISCLQSGAGQARYLNGSLEIYDGYSWKQLQSSYQTIELSYDAKLALDWANEKRQQEIEETALLEKYPSLKSAKGQYDMIRQLCMAEEKNGVIE